MNEAELACDACPDGKYANYLKVGHNAAEFLMDFGQFFLAQQGPVHYHTRLVTTPEYMKEFVKVLSESVEQYESTFGEIASPNV